MDTACSGMCVKGEIMPPRDRLGVVVALIAVGLFCSSGLVLPARDLDPYGLSFDLTGRMLLGFVLLGLTCTGVDDIMRRHPKTGSQQLGGSSLGWILPTALIAVAYAFLSQPSATQTRIVGIFAFAATLSALVIAEYYVIDPTKRWHTVVRFSLHLGTYLVGVLLYTAIRLNVSADPAAAIAVSVVSVVLSLRLLCAQRCPPNRTWPYILGLGALLGIGSWLLGRWTVSPLSYSLVLTVLLYVLTGIVRQFLLGRLTRGVALEYVLTGGLILLVLLSYAR